MGVDKVELDVGSITPISDYEVGKLNKLSNDPVIKKFKKAFKFAGDIKEFILPEPKISDPLSLIDYAMSSSPGAVVGKNCRKRFR